MAQATYTLDFTDDIGLEYYNILKDGAKVGSMEYAVEQKCITSIYIKDEHRSQGIGTDIILAMSEEHGVVYLAPDNEGAQRLYKRLGKEVADNSTIYNDWGWAHDQGFGLYEIS